MRILSLDIATGGLSAAIFEETLEATGLVEIPWLIEVHRDGAAVLDPVEFEQGLSTIFRSFRDYDAISISVFMHNCCLLDAADQALTPIFTWLDRTGMDGVEYVRRAIGDEFHSRTGCRYYPM